MTRDETKQILMLMQAAYPNYNPADKSVTLNMYHEMLSEYPFNSVKMGLKSFIATDNKGYAPSVGQIIAKINVVDGFNQLTADEAWMLVEKAISDGNYHASERFAELPPEVQKVVGSPSRIREWASMDISHVQSVIYSNFARSFREMSSRNNEFIRLPSEVKKAIADAREKKAKEIEATHAWALEILNQGIEEN